MEARYRGSPAGHGVPVLLSYLLLAALYSCSLAQYAPGCLGTVERNKHKVHCDYITDFSSVTDAFTSSGQKVTDLTIASSPLLVLTRLDLDSPAFGELTDLSLEENGMTYFNPKLLQALTTITTLSLRNNNLTSLNADAFSGLGSVTYLRVDNNQISDINPTAFISLTNLQMLDLSRNLLSTIPAGIFQGKNKVVYLSLTENLITSVEEGALDDLVELERLYLDENNISTIDTKAFQAFTKLNTLGLSSNKLESLDSKLFENNPLIQLDISYNTLENLENFPLNISTLQILGLNYGEIQTIPLNYFENVPNIVGLYLRGNVISQLDANLFAQLNHLKSLHLTRNRLVSLNVNSFQQLYRILNQRPAMFAHLLRNNTMVGTDVNLDRNPWDCGTDDMVELRTWTTEHYVDFDKLFHCNSS